MFRLESNEYTIERSIVEKWNKNFQDYNTDLYKSEEKGIASQIEDWVYNYQDGIVTCEATVIRKNDIYRDMKIKRILAAILTFGLSEIMGKGKPKDGVIRMDV